MVGDKYRSLSQLRVEMDRLTAYARRALAMPAKSVADPNPTPWGAGNLVPLTSPRSVERQSSGFWLNFRERVVDLPTADSLPGCTCWSPGSDAPAARSSPPAPSDRTSGITHSEPEPENESDPTTDE